MSLSRRSLLASSLALPLLGRSTSGLKIGITDWNLNQTAKLEAVALARKLGFDGVQVSLGMKPVDGKLLLDNEELQGQYRAASKSAGIPLDGTCLDILHVNYLKNDKLGQKWVADGIAITQKLGVKVMLLPFFGKGAIKTKEEQDAVASALTTLAPLAEKAGVILGLENTISAEENAAILDRVASKAVLVYYDVGNSTKEGYEVAREIRWLGRKRICQFHLKDNPHYLGEGTIDFPQVMGAIAELDFHGFANLETDSPSHTIDADLKRNLSFVRRTMTEA